MFEAKTLNVPELAARWGKSPRQILEHAASTALPLLFDFDGLVIDAMGERLAQFDADQQLEHEKLTAFVHAAESKFKRRIAGLLRVDETLTVPEGIALRKELTTAQAKIKELEELFDEVTRARQKYHFRGPLRATPATVDELQRLGCAEHPIRAYRPEGPFKLHTVDGVPVLDGPMVRLEEGAAKWKERLEPADMFVSMAHVKAIEAADKPKPKEPAHQPTKPSPAQVGAVGALGGTVAVWTTERKNAAIEMMNEQRGQGIKAFAANTATAFNVSPARLREVLKDKPKKAPAKKSKGVWDV